MLWGVISEAGPQGDIQQRYMKIPRGFLGAYHTGLDVQYAGGETVAGLLWGRVAVSQGTEGGHRSHFYYTDFLFKARGFA